MKKFYDILIKDSNKPFMEQFIHLLISANSELEALKKASTKGEILEIDGRFIHEISNFN